MMCMYVYIYIYIYTPNPCSRNPQWRVLCRELRMFASALANVVAESCGGFLVRAGLCGQPLGTWDPDL